MTRIIPSLSLSHGLQLDSAEAQASSYYYDPARLGPLPGLLVACKPAGVWLGLPDVTVMSSQAD
jgi:hypothetical protein